MEEEEEEDEEIGGAVLMLPSSYTRVETPVGSWEPAAAAAAPLLCCWLLCTPLSLPFALPALGAAEAEAPEALAAGVSLGEHV